MRIIPYRKVAELDVLLLSFLEGERLGEIPFHGLRFIVPSRRDRDWWSARVDRRDFGLGMENTARLWNWADLYADLCSFLEAPSLRQIDPPDHRLILSYIVREFLREQKTERGLLELWPGLARSGFVDVLSGDIRELINESVSAEQLSVTISDNKPTSEVLPCLYERYLSYLRRNRLLDSAQIPATALELLENKAAENWAEEKKFIFVGFMSFTSGQLALLRRLEELCGEEIVILKPATELKNFQDATLQLGGNAWEKDIPLTPGRIISFFAADHVREAEMVARFLALWRAGEGVLSRFPFPGFGAVGMLVPEQRVMAMESALRRYHVPYSLARGRDIAQTPAGMLLGPLWGAWSQGLEPYETSLLLAHPAFAGANFPIDAAIRSGPRGLKGWETYLRRNAKDSEGFGKKQDAWSAAALKALKAIAQFCGALEKGVSPAGLFGALYDFLTVSGLWVDALADFSLNSPGLDDALRELAASVAEVRAKYLALRELRPDLGPAGSIVLKGKEAIDFLRSWSEKTLVRPSPPLLGAVTLYTGPPPILASYPVWIMTDVTQKNWPGVIHSSPLLDTPEREALALASAYLPSVRDKYAQKEAFFRRLLHTGDELTLLSQAAVDEEGRPVNATSFLRSFLTDMKGFWNCAEPLPEELRGDGPEYFPSIEAGAPEPWPQGSRSPRNERAVPAVQSAVAEKYYLPVSDLHNLLDCPLRYWLKSHLKLKTRDMDLFSKIEVGQLTHAIWENVWRRQSQERDAPLFSLTADEWRRALKLEGNYIRFERLLKDNRLERHRKNIEFYIKRLANVQQNVLDRLIDCGLSHSSVKVEMDLAPYEVDGVIFTGRCDRVEVLKGNFLGAEGAVIMDYKWGRAASYEKKGTWPQFADSGPLRPTEAQEAEAFQYGLQLSAYALMYAAGGHQSILGVGFLGHKDGEIAGSFAPLVAGCYIPGKTNLKNGSVLEERAEEALKAMKIAAAILKSGRYEPCYSANNCRFCDVKGICRKGERIGDASLKPEEEKEEEDEERE